MNDIAGTQDANLGARLAGIGGPQPAIHPGIRGKGTMGTIPQSEEKSEPTPEPTPVSSEQTEKDFLEAPPEITFRWKSDIAALKAGELDDKTRNVRYHNAQWHPRTIWRRLRMQTDKKDRSGIAQQVVPFPSRAESQTDDEGNNNNWWIYKHHADPKKRGFVPNLSRFPNRAANPAGRRAGPLPDVQSKMRIRLLEKLATKAYPANVAHILDFRDTPETNKLGVAPARPDLRNINNRRARHFWWGVNRQGTNWESTKTLQDGKRLMIYMHEVDVLKRGSSGLDTEFTLTKSGQEPEEEAKEPPESSPPAGGTGYGPAAGGEVETTEDDSEDEPVLGVLGVSSDDEPIGTKRPAPEPEQPAKKVAAEVTASPPPKLTLSGRLSPVQKEALQTVVQSILAPIAPIQDAPLQGPQPPTPQPERVPTPMLSALNPLPPPQASLAPPSERLKELAATPGVQFFSARRVPDVTGGATIDPSGSLTVSPPMPSIPEQSIADKQLADEQADEDFEASVVAGTAPEPKTVAKPVPSRVPSRSPSTPRVSTSASPVFGAASRSASPVFGGAQAYVKTPSPSPPPVNPQTMLTSHGAFTRQGARTGTRDTIRHTLSPSPAGMASTVILPQRPAPTAAEQAAMASTVVLPKRAPAPPLPVNPQAMMASHGAFTRQGARTGPRDTIRHTLSPSPSPLQQKLDRVNQELPMLRSQVQQQRGKKGGPEATRKLNAALGEQRKLMVQLGEPLKKGKKRGGSPSREGVEYAAAGRRQGTKAVPKPRKKKKSVPAEPNSTLGFTEHEQQRSTAAYRATSANIKNAWPQELPWMALGYMMWKKFDKEEMQQLVREIAGKSARRVGKILRAHKKRKLTEDQPAARKKKRGGPDTHASGFTLRTAQIRKRPKKKKNTELPPVVQAASRAVQKPQSKNKMFFI